MLQIVLLVLGVVAMVMGFGAIVMRKVQLSGQTKLRGRQAVLAGLVTIAVGVGVLGFALIGIPLMIT